MTFVCEIGFITPPFGINLFGMGGALPEVSMTTVYKGVMPFIAADMVILVILMAFPWLSLVLLKYM